MADEGFAQDNWRVCTPSELLAAALASGEMRSQCVLLTGQRGVGKSTWCAALAKLAQRHGWHVEGIWSPAVLVQGVKIAIDLEDLATGERRRLATGLGNEARSAYGLRWHFDEGTLAWGNAVLVKVDKADLLILDELGPLEFTHGEGLTEGIRLLDGGRYQLAVAVIRPELLPQARRRWPGAWIVTPPNRGAPGSA